MKTYADFGYNYHEYSGNKFYITLGIHAGVATRYFLVDEKEVFESNLAFCNVLANYINEDCQKCFKFHVDRTVTTVSYVGKTETMGDDIALLLKKVFKLELNIKKFESVKHKTIENFKKVYKNGDFRGWYKSYEIADLNKGFLLKTLIDDLQKITWEKFSDCYERIVTPFNSCTYINGNIRDLSREEIANINNILAVDKPKVILGGRVIDPYVRGDAHLLEISRECCNLDIVCFSFEESIGMLDRLIYLMIESDKIPYQMKTVHLDEFDASLIVNEDGLMKLQNYYRKLSSSEQFEKSRNILLCKYKNWLDNNPERFGNMYVELELNNISTADYLDVLSNLTYEVYQKIGVQIKPIISEAQIVMRR